MVHVNPEPLEVAQRHRPVDRSALLDDLRAQALFSRTMMGVRSFLPVLEYGGLEPERFMRLYGGYLRQLREHRPPPPLSGVGSLTPRLILVADQVNPRTSWAGLPFDGGPAAAYLHETLSRTVIPPKDLHLLNSTAPDGRTTIAHELAYLRRGMRTGGVRFAALGEKAHAWLDDLAVDHVELEHPQFRRRFKHDKMDQYVRQLNEVYL
jgi:hypothetical protein